MRACKAKSSSKKKVLRMHLHTIPYNFATLDIVNYSRDDLTLLQLFHPLLQVNVQKATEVIVRRFRHRILALEARHLGEKKK